MPGATVAAVRCARYEEAADAVERLLRPLGGMGRFVRPGQSVLVKPNLLSNHAPEEAVTTHPEVVRGVIRAVRGAGAHPWVADSPVNATGLEQVWRATGMEALCRDEQVPLVNLEKAGSETVDLDGFRFTIARPVLEADAVITVPKLKTHVLTHYTGAVKNLYGTVPGFQKTVLHKACLKPEAFGALLAAVFRRVKPVLAVADGIVGMDGNGPSGGRPVRLEVLAASADPVALDAMACRRFGIDARAVVHLREASRLGAGEVDCDRITHVGDPEAWTGGVVCVPATTVPLQHVPNWMAAVFGALLKHRPVFSEQCVFCGRCVKSCPAGALTLQPGTRPTLAADLCIECCCCHEVCPARAITMQASWAIRAWRALRGR